MTLAQTTYSLKQFIANQTMVVILLNSIGFVYILGSKTLVLKGKIPVKPMIWGIHERMGGGIIQKTILWYHI
jgi:hypothetical protein